MTTATYPQAVGDPLAGRISPPRPPSRTERGGEARKRPSRAPRIQQERIEGRYRPISTHQLLMAWWLFSAGHLTKRALRIYFAAHELAERRRYTGEQRKGHARFELAEIRKLVGGQGSPTADRDLRADLKRLSELGLVEITLHRINFATSIEQLALEDVSGFFTMWSKLRKGMGRRHVPVPRRTLRALAAGLRTADTAYILGAMLSAVFWHKKEGTYSVDGRLKDSWVANTFNIGLSSARAARRHLVELGWLRELETPQWLRNRYGTHVVVNVDWAGQEVANSSVTPAAKPTDTGTMGEGSGAAGSSTPRAQNAAGSSTPWLDRSSPSSKDSNTRKLGTTAPGPAGVSKTNGLDQKARRASKARKTQVRAPNIRDVRPEDLASPEALQTLYAQAIEAGLACSSGAGELDFFAMANRARTRGTRPGALFVSNLKNLRSHFITIADEEAGQRMIRELRDGPESPRQTPKKQERQLSEDERIVEVCLQQAKRYRGLEGFDLARRVKGWTREQWDRAESSYNQTQERQWYSADEFEADFTPFAGVAR